MKLVAQFLGEQGKIFGRDDALLTNLGIDDISNEEEIRQEIEDYLTKHDEFKVLSGVETEKYIKSRSVRTVNISENYLGGKSFSIDVTWDK
ncbi:hypothetical protein [Staphylococcus xylosus]|uniref:hypothetical protein n=1 Tax=Staphylococcus xylosus TaxID=1288 RepID=UPI003F547E14